MEVNTLLKYKERSYYKLRYLIGVASNLNGITKTANLFQISKSMVKYWKKKYNDPTFHNGTWGGFRWSKFKLDEELKILRLSIEYIKEQSLKGIYLNVNHILNYLNTSGIFSQIIKKTWLKNRFFNLGWRWRQSSINQIEKFSDYNINRYLLWINWMNSLSVEEIRKIKFMDESHFQPYKTKGPKMLCFEKERPVKIGQNLLEKNFTLTLMTSLSDSEIPFCWNLTDKNRTSYDFCIFLKKCYDSGFLKQGDILIMDNAPIHQSNDVIDFLDTFVSITDVKIYFQPTYSPELNPAEFIFNTVKILTRNKIGNNSTMMDIVREVLSTLSIDYVLSAYEKSFNLEKNYFLKWYKCN